MMLIFFVIVLTHNIKKCHTVHAGKIIGGHKAVSHSRPYMVLLEIKDKNDQNNYCAGFLLSEDFVMTAAHCQAKSVLLIL